MKTAQEKPKAWKPMTEPELHVLLSLAEGERHGYRMMREARERTGGRLRPGAGTLYGVLKRLKSRGLIEDTDVVEARGSGSRKDSPRRRRYYRLTEKSAQALVTDLACMETCARAWEDAVGGTGGGRSS